MLKVAVGNHIAATPISILNFVLGHILGVNQNFYTKFGTLMEN